MTGQSSTTLLVQLEELCIKDITIISNQFIGQIAKHVGSGFEDEKIHYVLEESPEGVRKHSI